MVDMINALAGLSDLLDRSASFIRKMHEIGAAPDGTKKLRRLYSPGEAASMVGRDRTTLARVEVDENVVGTVARDPATNRRLGYSLEQVQAFRAHFGTLPGRGSAQDQPLVLGCQNFKGGTGKSTLSTLLSNYLGEHGHRVLLVDTDSQATTTSFFGLVPDVDLTINDTLFPYLNGDRSTLEYAIRKTHWPTVDLIPACLRLSDVEVGGILRVATEEDPEARREFFKELRYGIATVANRYDVILVDTPPSLGVLSLMVLVAANALIVPTTAKMADFASTVQFFTMISDYIQKIDPEKNYYWIRVLVTQFSRRGKQSKEDKTLQEQFVEAMGKVFGDLKFKHAMFESAEIQSAAATFNTPYEQEKPNRRVLTQLEHVFAEIETSIQQCWPSKTEILSERALP
jgi:chromosome partitioning protein